MMNYEAHPISDAHKTFRDAKGTAWKYATEKDIRKKYPNGGFKVFGDIQKKPKTDAKSFLLNSNAKVGLYPFSGKHSWLKRTLGYISVTSEDGEEGFIRILTNAWQRPLIVLLIVLVAVSVFLGGMWFARKDEVPGLDKTAVSYHIDGVVNSDPESIMLPGVKMLNLKAGEKRIETVLANPDGNDCYFKYIIKLKDTGEVLYTSGLLKPGTAVTQVDLNRTFEPGSYPISVMVETRDLKDQGVAYNAGNMDATLKVT